MIQTLEAPPILEVIEQADLFDITRWLTPGVVYEHIALKHAMYAAGNAGLNAQPGDYNYRIGAAFCAAVYEWWERGLLEMTIAVDKDGDPTDFFNAVFMWPDKGEPEFSEKLVEGWLMVGEMQS